MTPDGGLSGAAAAVKAINECGGINGHPIKFVTCTDNESQDAALKCAEDAVGDGKALAVGAEGTSYGSLIDPIFAKDHMAVLGQAGPGSDVTSPNFFAPEISLLVSEADGIFAVKYLHLTKIGLPYLNVGNFGTAAAAAFKQLVTGPENIPQAVVVPIDVPETNFPGRAAALSSTTVITPALDTPRIIPLVQALNAQGARQPIVVNSSIFTNTDYKSVASLSPAPTIYDLSPFRLSGPGYSQYEADMKAIGQAGTVDDNGSSINSWITVREIADVANKIGPSVTRQSVLATLSGLSDYDTKGLTPPLNYTLRDPSKEFGNIVNSSLVYYKVTSTGYTPIDGGKFETGFFPTSLLP